MDREAFRAAELRKIGRWYSPVLHVIAPSAWGLAVLVACGVLVHGVTWQELLTVPIVLVMSNMTEWRIHRDLLHKRSWLMPALYDRHTPVHHRIYVHGDMQIRDWRELKLVLIPVWAGLVLLVALLPIAAALWFFVSPNTAYIFEATCMLYVVTYELLHMSYHLPANHPVGRNPIIRRLALHHSIHHHPPLMQKWNMNVSIPLWDLVRRTSVREKPETTDETTVGAASAPG